MNLRYSDGPAADAKNQNSNKKAKNVRKGLDDAPYGIGSEKSSKQRHDGKRVVEKQHIRKGQSPYLGT